MLKIKISGIIVVLFITATSAAIFNTGCYKDTNEARITIHLERHDLAFQKEMKQKKIIDRVLEFFSTPAYAGSTWFDVRDDLTLIVTGETFTEKIFTLPANSTTYSIILPANENVKFRITSQYTTDFNGVQKNWGGETIVFLSSGESDVIVKMLPMTFITGLGGSTEINISWLTMGIPAYVTTYNVYRSTSADGTYSYIGSNASFLMDITALSGITYYYRVSAVTSYGEGIMSDPLSYSL